MKQKKTSSDYGYWGRRTFFAEDLEEVRTREQHKEMEVEIVCLEVKEEQQQSAKSAAEALYRRWLNLV